MSNRRTFRRRTGRRTRRARGGGNGRPFRFTMGIRQKSSPYNTERLEKITYRSPMTVRTVGAHTVCCLGFTDGTNQDTNDVKCLYARTRFAALAHMYSTYEVTGVAVEVEPASVTTATRTIGGPVIGAGPGPGLTVIPDEGSIASMFQSSTGSAVGGPTRLYFSKNRYMVNSGSYRTSPTSQIFGDGVSSWLWARIPYDGPVPNETLGWVTCTWYVRFTGVRQLDAVALYKSLGSILKASESADQEEMIDTQSASDMSVSIRKNPGRLVFK